MRYHPLVNVQADFTKLVDERREELRAYCYRMLGSVQDAEDALQEALISAWRGLDGFEGRANLRSWLYKIVTHACYRLIEQRQPRVLPDQRLEAASGVELEKRIDDPIWLEPYPLPADAGFEVRESVELAFVVALQQLPAAQRAALILRDVLEFSAEETARLLDTSVASANSALQRARASVEQRAHARSQQQELAALGPDEERMLVEGYVAAWAAGDADALVRLLTEDVKFSMPPIPTWFAGREAVGRFFAERVFATPWRLVPVRASGQLAFACYQGPGFELGALNVVSLRGKFVSELTGFLDPAVHAYFSLPKR
jgi:RNA polymerase sigma-70 factor (TIGR02960 family)